MKEYPIIFKAEFLSLIETDIKKLTPRLSDIWAKRRPGDLLWVKEAWLYDRYFGEGYMYRRGFWTCEEAKSLKWNSPLSMPKEATRLWLEIVKIWEERLLSITKEGVQKEGFKNREEFLVAFEKINKIKRETNPTVFVIEFRRIKR